MATNEVNPRRGVEETPITYTHEELRIASQELNKAAEAFVASGAEFASYPVKVGRAPPRWVKFIGVNQLSRAAAGFAQALRSTESARDTMIAITSTTTKLQESMTVYESLTRLDHLKLAFFGSVKKKTPSGVAEIEAH